MVYGWTRDDFVKAVVNNPTDSLNTSISPSSYHGNDEPPSSDEDYEDQRTLVQTIPDLEGLKNGGEFAHLHLTIIPIRFVCGDETRERRD